MKERLLEYLAKKHLNPSKLERMLGWSNGYIAKVNDFSIARLAQITEACPDINLDWLLTGRGNMYNDGSMPEGVSVRQSVPSAFDVLKYERRIAELEAQVEVLKDLIRSMSAPGTHRHL